jgi:hypothetical protein
MDFGDMLEAWIARKNEKAEDRALLNAMYQPPDDSSQTTPDQYAQAIGLTTPDMSQYNQPAGPSQTNPPDPDEVATQASKAATAYRTIAQHEFGLSKEQVNTMGLGELRGTTKALALRQELAQYVEQQKQYAEKQKQRLAYGAFQGAMAGMDPENIDFGQVINAAAKSGALTPDLAVKMAERNDAARERATAKNNGFFKPDDMGSEIPGTQWSRVPTGPNSAQLVFKGDVNTPMPQEDEAGNLLGYSTVDAKGKSTFHKADSPLKPAFDSTTNERIPGYYQIGGKIVDTRSGLQKMLGNKAASESTQGGQPASAQAGYVKGTRYKDRSGKLMQYLGGDPKSETSWKYE